MTIDEGIAKILNQPKRDFQAQPLNQLELSGIMEWLTTEVNRDDLDEEIAHFYLSVYEFLKAKVLYN